jgi:hypothetical protein
VILFVIASGLSVALAVALVYLAVTAPSLTGEAGSWSLGIAGRVALWAVISWIPTILVLVVLERMKRHRTS